MIARVPVPQSSEQWEFTVDGCLPSCEHFAFRSASCSTSAPSLLNPTTAVLNRTCDDLFCKGLMMFSKWTGSCEKNARSARWAINFTSRPLSPKAQCWWMQAHFERAKKTPDHVKLVLVRNMINIAWRGRGGVDASSLILAAGVYFARPGIRSLMNWFHFRFFCQIGLSFRLQFHFDAWPWYFVDLLGKRI